MQGDCSVLPPVIQRGQIKDPLIPVCDNRNEEYNAVTEDEFRQWPNREAEELMGKTYSVLQSQCK